MKALRETKTDAAYGYIKGKIHEGAFSPGYRLVLGQLAKDTGVSEFPVREALRRLATEGYVTFERNAGARVAELDRELYESAQQVIAALEGAATAAAAPFISQDVLDRAAAINQQMKDRRDSYDAEGFIQLNAQFHDLLCGPCPNMHLLELLQHERLRLPVRPTFGIIMRNAQQFVDDHDELVRLIRTKSPAYEIQIFAQAHKQRVLETVQQATTAVPLSL